MDTRKPTQLSDGATVGGTGGGGGSAGELVQARFPSLGSKEEASRFWDRGLSQKTLGDFRVDHTLLPAKACHAAEGTSRYQHPLETSPRPTSISPGLGGGVFGSQQEAERGAPDPYMYGLKWDSHCVDHLEVQL